MLAPMLETVSLMATVAPLLNSITETTDAVTLIVSEETGTISMAREGHLTRHLDRAGLEQVLLSMYHQREGGLWTTLLEKTKRRKGGAA